MKKFVTYLILILFIFRALTINVSAKSVKPTVSADSAVLIDATTGEILYSKNKDMAYAPASTTKIMTALLTFERCKLDEVVQVGSKPPLADGSKIYIFEGENLTVNELLHGLLLPSANDCAEALAEHISGSKEEFAKLMNKRAKQLGCKNTNFVNPSGLYDVNHKTSSYDLALIMRELEKHPEYKVIATTSSYNIGPTNKTPLVRPLWNENKLIQKTSQYYYTGIEGGKTGYTTESAHSYVASATRNGQRLIVALVHDTKKTFWEDSTNLFNYGFNNFKLTKLYSKGDPVTIYKSDNLSVPLLSTNDFYFVNEKDNKDLPKFIFKDINLNNDSFKTGDYLLQAGVTINNKNIGNINLSSGIDHVLKPLVIAEYTLKNSALKIFYGILSIMAVILAILLARKRVRTRRKNKIKSIFNKR